MPEIAKTQVADQGQRRASFQQARSHETKRSLIQAAMALWRANGYARTTVADICARAGMATGSFYAYFDSKLEIFSAVVRQANRARPSDWLGPDVIGLGFAGSLATTLLKREATRLPRGAAQDENKAVR